MNDDAWGGMESANEDRNGVVTDPWTSEADPWRTNPSSYPTLSTQPRKAVHADNRGATITSSRRSTPISSPPPPDVMEDAERMGSNTASVTSGKVSKEDKAAEMARRKEERRQVSELFPLRCMY